MAGSPQKFGLVFKSFHWIMAVIILMLLSVGFRMAAIEPSPAKFQLYWWHKSFGILILMLAVGRIGWRLFAKRPAPSPTIKHWEETLAKIVHFGLYCMFIMIPLSGWIMSSAGDFPASFFGLFELPHIAPKSEQIMMSAGTAHLLFALGIMGLLGLHFAGAFKHHFIDRDETLKRMTWDRLGFGGGVIFVLIAGVGLGAPALLFLKGQMDESAQQEQIASGANITMPTTANQENILRDGVTAWTIDTDASYIKFIATQYGTPFEGRFKRFGAKIFFDPQKLEQSYVDIGIGLSQPEDIETGSADRDAQIRGGEWFDTANHPLASFIAESFEAGPPSKPAQYIAHGTLTIRGVSKKLDLPFTLDIDDKIAEMRSEITLNRADFGVGQGEWTKTDIIGADVKIQIYVKATQQ